MDDDNVDEKLSNLAKAIRDEQLARKSHKEIMLNNNSKSIEMNAIDNERFFKKIYSFSKPKHQRKQLYLWKHQLDLLDPEIKNLEYTKSIIIEPSQPSVVHIDKLSLKIARITIFILYAAILLSVLLLIESDFRKENFLTSLATIALTTLGIWHLNTSVIKPSKILKKRGIIPGEKVNLHSAKVTDKIAKKNGNIIPFNKK